MSSGLPPEPPLTLLFSDRFDSGALYLWTLGAGWSLAASESGLALQALGSEEPVTFVHANLGDAAVQARFRFTGGQVRLSLRQSAAGSYTAALDAGGRVTLYRGGQVIGAATVAPTIPGQWRTLRLAAIGDIVRVAVDGVEALAVVDSAPQPPGTLDASGRVRHRFVSSFARGVKRLILPFWFRPPVLAQPSQARFCEVYKSLNRCTIEIPGSTPCPGF